MRMLTTTQYTKGTKLSCDEGIIYLVENSIDYAWWTKKEENKGKYLTQLKIVGKLNKTLEVKNDSKDGTKSKDNEQRNSDDNGRTSSNGNSAEPTH